MSSVEVRMDTIERTMVENRAATAAESTATHNLLNEVLQRLGKPSDGPAQPASGIYWAVDQVSTRLHPFEQFRERAKGSLGTILALSPIVGAIGWFLTGDKLTHLFHG